MFCCDCWDELALVDSLVEDAPTINCDLEVFESAKPSVIKELKRLLFEVLKKKRGVVRFAFIKKNGILRHARAVYNIYVPKTKRVRPTDIITYFDADKRGYRSFHEDQLVDTWPQWSRN